MQNLNMMLIILGISYQAINMMLIISGISYQAINMMLIILGNILPSNKHDVDYIGEYLTKQ